MDLQTVALILYLLLLYSCLLLFAIEMSGTVELALASTDSDNIFSFSPRPVPGSLSSLLHLHNRQRQPMPASMPGTLPNPTMPGSSAVLMPVSYFILILYQALSGAKIYLTAHSENEVIQNREYRVLSHFALHYACFTQM